MKASILHRPIKKVILIFPPMNHPRIYSKQCCLPMGIAYLGAVLRDHYDVRLLDAVVELEHLKTVHGIQEVKFEDDNFTLDPKRAKAICRGMIEHKLNLSWNIPSGAMVKTMADRELVRLMKHSGCYEVSLAFESGDPWG